MLGASARVSEAGYVQLLALQREYLLKARALIADSLPEERALLLQISLVPFDLPAVR